MDQIAMVIVSLRGGWMLIDTLVARGIPIESAFWAKLIDEERWKLYLATPAVEGQRTGTVYQTIHAILRDAPEWGIDPFSIIVLESNDPMAEAAAAVVKPKVPAGSHAGPTRKPYRGVTPFRGSSLGGNQIDGAIIYPPWEAGMTLVS